MTRPSLSDRTTHVYDDVCVWVSSSTLTSIISVCHQRAGGVTVFCECESVFAYSVRVYRPLACVFLTCAWLCWSQRSQFAGWGVFPMTPCGTADVLMCSASVKWLSAAHCTAAAKHCTLFNMSALQKSSSLCFHSLSSNSEMIFIPLGMLDKFPLSPLNKRILGRVSFTQLITSVFGLNWKCAVLIPH